MTPRTRHLLIRGALLSAYIGALAGMYAFLMEPVSDRDTKPNTPSPAGGRG